MKLPKALAFSTPFSTAKVPFRATLSPKYISAISLTSLGCFEAKAPNFSRNGKAVFIASPVSLKPAPPMFLTISKKFLMSFECVLTKLPSFSIWSAVPLAISAMGFFVPLKVLLNALEMVLTALLAESPTWSKADSTSFPSSDLDMFFKKSLLD